MTRWFYPGEAERTKLAAHAGLGTLALVCATYNLCAWLLRGEAHLLRNVAIYSALTALEVTQIQKHREGAAS